MADNKNVSNKLNNKPVAKKSDRVVNSSRSANSNRVISKAEIARENSEEFRARKEALKKKEKELDQYTSMGASTSRNVKKDVAIPVKKEQDSYEFISPTEEKPKAVEGRKNKAKPSNMDKEAVELQEAGFGSTKGTIRFTMGILVNSIIVLLIVQTFMLSFNFAYKMFANVACDPSDKEQIKIEILPDSSSVDIVDLLEENNIIDDKWVMMGRIKVGKYNSRLKAGTYMLSPSMTTDEILDTLSGDIDKADEEEK